MQSAGQESECFVLCGLWRFALATGYPMLEQILLTGDGLFWDAMMFQRHVQQKRTPGVPQQQAVTPYKRD